MPPARRSSYFSPRLRRDPRRSKGGVLCAAATALVLLACSEPAATPTPPGEAAPPEITDPWAASLPDLRRAASADGARAAELAGTAEGVAAGRRAAAMARILSIRDPEAEWVGRARAWLQEASRRRALPGACDAANELAELEARDAADVTAAYRVAYRTTRRFPRDEACVARAQRILGPLAPWRPGDAILAAIDADPDGDDPSAGLDAPSAPGAAPADDAAAWAAEHAEAGASARLEALTVYAHGDDEEAASARVVLRFDRVVAFEHGEADASAGQPRRTWLELAGAAPAEGVARALPVAAGGLRRIRTDPHEGGVRVTFELGPDARFRAFVLPEPFRIVLDVEPAGPRARGPVRLVVLDPGHGGDDFGARAYGMRESDLTLELARRVRVLLARRLPDVRVVLTREEDTLISLEQRAAMANALDADLFLSIHLNAADEPVDRGGVTTFVLDTSNDRQALRLAARENGTRVADVSSLSHLLASLHREEQVAGSRALAEQVHRATLAAGRGVLPRLHDRGVRSAMFYVLVGARMPAVLLEASFLSQEEEAAALRTPSYRQALAAGVVEGIARYAGR